MRNNTSVLPLESVRVIEMGSSFSGPSACETLAMMGAEVIKIENPQGGDVTRTWGPDIGGQATIGFDAVNREKRSLALDLSNQADRQIFLDLIVDIDIVIQNMRPGLVDKMGLGATDLQAMNPRLIYCNIGAFGNEGPQRDRPGYDPLMQAFSGMLSVTGAEDGEPARVGVPLIDFGVGMWAIIGVLGALQLRHVTGAGTVVDASMLDASLFYMKYNVAEYMATGVVPKRMGTRGPAVAPNRSYRASDGDIMVCIGTDAQFAVFAKAVGHVEWASDERFVSNQARRANEVEMDRLIEALFLTQPVDHWATLLEQAGIGHAKAMDTAELLEHPQFKAIGILQEHPKGQVPMIGLPLKFNGQRPAYRRPPPELDEYRSELWRSSVEPE